MTRIEGMNAVANLVRSFCADDVKDWLAEACTAEAGQARRDGRTDESRDWMHFANDVAAVRNRGV